MLVISQRDCRLGLKYSGKHHKGTDEKPEHDSLKLQLEGIQLVEAEFNALFQSAHAWGLLRDEAGAPSLDALRCFELKGLKFEGAHVTVWHSLGSEKIELPAATLTKVQLTIGDDEFGGNVTMAISVEGAPALDAKLVELLARVGRGIEVEIRADHPNAQAELPLNRHGEGEQPEGSKRKGRKGRGRGELVRH